MNKEIEKLFKKFDIILKNYELDKKFGQLSVDSICHLFPTEIINLKQYIQELQHQLEEKNKVINEIKNALTNYKSEWADDDEVVKDIDTFLKILERGKNGKK